MKHGFRLYLVGSLVLVALAGCGRGFFQTAEREPWRAEAEAACLKSGEVRETAELVRIDPISGPGVCGAQFPLKVAAFGEARSSFGYAEELRPPANIGRNQPRWPVAQPPTYQQQPAYQQPAYVPPRTEPVTSQPYPPPSQEGPGGAAFREPIALGRPDTVPSTGAPVPEDPDASQPYSQPRLGPSYGSPVAAFGPVALKPAATLACPIVSALNRWLSEAVQPAAMRWFGAPVVEIKQISAYSCRGMNGNPNARISEHAFGNALDIASFTLADGRRISVQEGWKGLPEEQGFLRDVAAAACRDFSTVLAPGSNIYHYNHIHVDLMRRASGRAICKPAAVSGEEVAARAMRQRGYAGRDMRVGGVTGSIPQASRAKLSAKAQAAADEDGIEDESYLRNGD